MTIENFDETQPTPVGNGTQEIESPQERKRASWVWWLLLVIVMIIGVVALSGLLGYQKGITQRTNFEATQVAQAVGEQFELGVQNMEAGRYEVARKRFEYVIELKPDYPGAIDKLAEVLLILNVTATPTPVPTATLVPITPTPDLRGEAELFAQAEDFIANQEWSNAIETLETLRQNNSEYQAIDVDGMLFLSLRQRGVKKISEGDLEGGIYDLTLAEKFGPLDTEADSWRTWARYYITGASFWEVDWSQAVYYFEQVAPMYPNMHDGSGWFASQRYLEAMLQYAEWLEEHKDWCLAEEQYIKAYEYSGNSDLEEVIEIVADKCR